MSVAFLGKALAVPAFVFSAFVACSSDENKPVPVACDEAKCLEGNRCVDGECSLLCTRHADCPEERGYHCTPGALDDGSGDVPVCRPGAVPKLPGGYGFPCGLHLDTDCNAAEGFVCPGKQNDVDAFCTKPGACTADADCPSDMYCGSLRRMACVSLTACTAPTDCERLADSNCTDFGAGTSYCVAPSSCHVQPDDCPLGVACTPLPGAGTEYETVSACVPRRECAPCSSNADCADANAVCLQDAEGEGFCAKPCDPEGTSCDPGSECVSTEAGDRCIPRAGRCHGDASPCAPCRDDLDCGAGSCEVVDATKERYCLAPCDGSCPSAPGGGEMTCRENSCVPVGHANPYPRTSSGCWLRFCVTNGGCADGELCDVRELSLVNDRELLTQCGTKGVCRTAHDPTDAVDFQIHERVCDCEGNQYFSEGELATQRDAAFRGCCFSVTSATTGNTYSCPTP